MSGGCKVLNLRRNGLKRIRLARKRFSREGPEGERGPPFRKKIRRWRKRPPCKGKRNLRAKPEAPFNTTQFLMDEHNDYEDLTIVRPPRRRDSSFSMESDDVDDFYFSPEDEEDFLTKEFSTAYEDVHMERLGTMSRVQLIQEYLALEEQVDALEEEVHQARLRDRLREMSPDEDGDPLPGEVKVDPETAAKIEIIRNEIMRLEEENARLRQEATSLRRVSSSSSSSSSSASDTSDDEAATAGDVSLVEGAQLCKLTFDASVNFDSGLASCEGLSSSSYDDVRTDGCPKGDVTRTADSDVRN